MISYLILDYSYSVPRKRIYPSELAESDIKIIVLKMIFFILQRNLINILATITKTSKFPSMMPSRAFLNFL